MNETRINLLLDKYRCGTLTDAERSELERELLSSAPARELFWKQARFHALLARWGQEAWGRRMAEKPQPEPSWRWWWAGVAAAAAVIAIAAVIFFGRRAEPVQAPGVAVLALANGVEWTDGGHVPGALLAPGWLRLTAGAAQVEFYSGARVIIEGPAELQLVSANEAFCRSGRLSARVPAAARGFKVGAPGMVVTDLGTEFGMRVVPESAPEVHVFAGKVELRRSAAAAPVELMEGKAVRVEATTLVAIAADRAAFLSEAEMARRVAARTMTPDPAMLVHFTFGNEQPWERTVANQAAGTPGSIVGCQWTTGRWPGKGALRFSGAGDRVRFAVPGTLHAVTLLAWVRVDALPNEYHALLLPDGMEPGTLRWGVMKSGRLRLSIARESGKSEPNWEVVMSTPVVTRERFGQWLLLATTFDGKTVRHYLNGEPMGELPAYSPVPLRIGAAELGNWIGPEPRFLVASVDEFAILARALSAAEVRNVFQQGQQ